MKRLALPALLLLMAISGCTVNPVTGESDFVVIDEREEVGMGMRYDLDIRRQFPRYRDPRVQAYVQQVGGRLARHSQRRSLTYRFTVLDTPIVNAFALPGGYIYVTRGLMGLLNSESELAAVLGHEIGHVAALHSVRQQSQARAWGTAGQMVARTTGVLPARNLANILGTAFVRGYGREMELEADQLGAEYLMKAGYDPEAMTRVVRILKRQQEFARAEAAKAGGTQPTQGHHGVFDTHPGHDQRLRKLIETSRAQGRPEVGNETYLRHIDGMIYGQSAGGGVHEGRHYYHAGLNFAMEIPANWKLSGEPRTIVMTAPDGESTLKVRQMEPEPNRSIPDFLRRNAGTDMINGQSLRSVNGYTAILPGRLPRRVAAIYHARQAFLFISDCPSQKFSRQDAIFLKTIHSFRPLSVQERARFQSRRIRMVQVKPGQTLEQFAIKEHESLADAVARLRVLNDLPAPTQPRAGDWIKILQ